jgi:lantibiotic modifying enzyme
METRIPDKSIYNLGTAHGRAGVIIFLSKLHSLGLEKERTKNLIEEAIAWLLKKELYRGNTSLFPSFSEEVRNEEWTSRLAWCNGDLCVAVALAFAGSALSDDSYKEKAIHIATHECGRGIKESKVKADADFANYDPSFCHGTAGIAHVFRKFSKYTGLPEFENTTKRWLNLTFDARKVGANALIGGFKTYFHDNNGENIYWEYERGLFRGSAGIGLVLISQLSESLSSWERAFLLDF